MRVGARTFLAVQVHHGLRQQAAQLQEQAVQTLFALLHDLIHPVDQPALTPQGFEELRGVLPLSSLVFHPWLLSAKCLWTLPQWSHTCKFQLTLV